MMEIDKKLTDYEFIERLKEEPSWFFNAYTFSYDEIDGHDVLAIKNQEGEILKYGNIQAIIKGLSNFLKTNSPVEISDLNKQIRDQFKRKEIKSAEKDSIIENKNYGVVYLLKIKNKPQYKIGVTKDLNKRLNQISPKMPFELKIEHKIESDNIYSLEEKLHNKFEDKQIKGEWFKLNENDVSYIKSL